MEILLKILATLSIISMIYTIFIKNTTQYETVGLKIGSAIGILVAAYAFYSNSWGCLIASCSALSAVTELFTDTIRRNKAPFDSLGKFSLAVGITFWGVTGNWISIIVALILMGLFAYLGVKSK